MEDPNRRSLHALLEHLYSHSSPPLLLIISRPNNPELQHFVPALSNSLGAVTLQEAAIILYGSGLHPQDDDPSCRLDLYRISVRSVAESIGTILGHQNTAILVCYPGNGDTEESIVERFGLYQQAVELNGSITSMIVLDEVDSAWEGVVERAILRQNGITRKQQDRVHICRLFRGPTATADQPKDEEEVPADLWTD